MGLVKSIFFILLLTGWAAPVWAGTEILAKVESVSGPDDWVEVDALVDHGKAQLKIRGPWSYGSVIYDEKTAQITLVDDLHRTIVPITQTDQTTFKMMSYLLAGKIKGQVERTSSSVQLAYHLVEANARALCDGTSALTKKDVRVNGFLCDLYEARTDGGKNRQVWMAACDGAAMTSEDNETLWNLTRSIVELFGDELTQMGAEPDSFLKGYSSASFPVQTVLYTNGKVSSRFQILKIRRRALEPDDFDPPANYKTLSLMNVIERGLQSSS